MNFSKFNRITHRDIGYLVAGLTIIYALSGIALNHKHDRNPNYLVDSYEFTGDMKLTRESFNDDIARAILKSIPGNPEFKTSCFPSGNRTNICSLKPSLLHSTLLPVS